MNVYPSWRYHREQEARIVRSAEEDKALGEGWEDSPAKFEIKEEAPEGQGGPACPPEPESYREHMGKWESKDEKKPKAKRGSR